MDRRRSITPEVIAVSALILRRKPPSLRGPNRRRLGPLRGWKIFIAFNGIRAREAGSQFDRFSHLEAYGRRPQAQRIAARHPYAGDALGLNIGDGGRRGARCRSLGGCSPGVTRWRFQCRKRVENQGRLSSITRYFNWRKGCPPNLYPSLF